MLQLTPNEKLCLQWAAAGKTSFEIGAILSISPRTVDYHISNVCHKLGVHSRQAAVVVAVELGLLPNIRDFLPTPPDLHEDLVAALNGKSDPEPDSDQNVDPESDRDQDVDPVPARVKIR